MWVLMLLLDRWLVRTLVLLWRDVNVWWSVLGTGRWCLKGGTVGLRGVDERALLDVRVYGGGAEVLVAFLYALLRAGSSVVVVVLEGVVHVGGACKGPIRRFWCASRTLVLIV